MVTPSRRRLHGTLYVFDTKVGFVYKMFGIKQHEVVPLRRITEVLRESFTLKLSECGIEMLTVTNSAYRFFPVTSPVRKASLRQKEVV